MVFTFYLFIFKDSLNLSEKVVEMTRETRNRERLSLSQSQVRSFRVKSFFWASKVGAGAQALGASIAFMAGSWIRSGDAKTQWHPSGLLAVQVEV